MRQAKTPSSSAQRDPRLDSLGAPIEVRRHPAARRLTLRVSRTRRAVIVTLPVQCDLGEADSFVSRNIEWVRERLGNLPEVVPFRCGVVMPLRGEPHRLVFTNLSSGVPVSCRHEANRVAEIHVSGQDQHAPRRLRDWLFEEARRDLDRRVLWHAKRLEVEPKRIAIRDQSSRWGSCSTTKVLSFTWRLVLAPPRILDYVAAHEVAHLREMNHGPRFWALVEKTMPDMDDARCWLQIYGMDLHRYGVEGRR